MAYRYRNTKQKTAIHEVISHAERPLTAQQIEERAKLSVQGIGIATVYRALKRLQEEGQVTVVELTGKPPLYELTEKGPHHHFVCNNCGQVYDVEGSAEQVTHLAPEGFQVDKHEVTLYGTCSECGE